MSFFVSETPLDVTRLVFPPASVLRICNILEFCAKKTGATTNAAGVVTNIGIPAGSSSFLNPVPGGHQYWDAAARLTYAPVLTEDNLLHLGGWVRYQKPNDATAASDDRVLQPGGTLAEEANAVGSALLGTQPLTCVAATAQLPGRNCTKNVLSYGAELVASYGPFSVQGEYIGMHYDRDAGLLAIVQAALLILDQELGEYQHSVECASFSDNPEVCYGCFDCGGIPFGEQFISNREVSPAMNRQKQMTECGIARCNTSAHGKRGAAAGANNLHHSDFLGTRLGTVKSSQCNLN